MTIRAFCENHLFTGKIINLPHEGGFFLDILIFGNELSHEGCWFFKVFWHDEFCWLKLLLFFCSHNNYAASWSHRRLFFFSVNTYAPSMSQTCTGLTGGQLASPRPGNDSPIHFLKKIMHQIMDRSIIQSFSSKMSMKE